MNHNNYNYIAPIYDGLVKLVFGSSLIKAKLCLLPYLKPKNSILIVGGGTGQMIPPLLNLLKEGKLYFVEKSSKMIQISKKRVPKDEKHRVEMIKGTVSDIPGDVKFDLIMTNFFLDQFPEVELKQLIAALNKTLIAGGNWYYTDFVLDTNNKHYWWQKILVLVMYQFFRLTTNGKTQRLIDTTTFFKINNLRLVREEKTYKGLICTRLYEKDKEASSF